jgi:leucyl aminopeptidase
MHALLPDSREIRVIQQLGKVTAAQLDAVDQLLLILPEKPGKAVWKSVPQGTKLQAVMRRRPTGSVPALQSRLANKRHTLVVAGTLEKDADTFAQLTLARKLVAAATAEKAGNLGILVIGFGDDAVAGITGNALAAALAGAFALPEFKSKPSPARIRGIRLLGLSAKLDLGRIRAEAAGNNLARWLTAMPPNKLDATGYADMLQSLAKDRGWEYKRFGTKELEKMGAGAFLAVAQGNDDDSASIVRLRYRPAAKSTTADLSLVGKGIIFDTGGTNLKPFQAMLDMHGDMQGSAVALGTFLAINEMQLPMAVDCWLAMHGAGRYPGLHQP